MPPDFDLLDARIALAQADYQLLKASTWYRERGTEGERKEWDRARRLIQHLMEQLEQVPAHDR